MAKISVRYIVDDVDAAIDIEATVADLREHGARFRNDIVAGVGGKQILVEDPAGNPIELFEPTIAEAKL
jgi:catechol 2,3-dioxygenase-like lactoylglutathione lyase family enzyme